MAEEFIIKILGGAADLGGETPAGVKGGTSGGSGAGGLGKLLGPLLKIATIATALMGVVQPVIRIVTTILKLIGEFLRPIAEIFVILLKPILIILQPLLMVFRQLMAPFLRIAREFGAIAAQKAAAGDIGGAMEAGLQAAAAVFAPFIIAFANVLGQLFIPLILGNIKMLINSVIDIIATLVGFIPWIGDGAKKAILGLKGPVADAVSATEDLLTKALTDGTIKVLAKMEAEFNKMLDEAGANAQGDYNSRIRDISAETSSEKAKREELEKQMKMSIDPAMVDNLIKVNKAIKIFAGSTDDFINGSGEAGGAGGLTQSVTDSQEAFTNFLGGINSFIGEMNKAASAISAIKINRVTLRGGGLRIGLRVYGGLGF